MNKGFNTIPKEVGNMTRTFITAIFMALFSQTVWSAELAEIQLKETLDEMRGFCIDIRGHKQRAMVKKGLQAHSCYSYQGQIAVDQAFDKNLLKQNSFFMPAFDVCMEAKGRFKGASLILSKCKDKDVQKFELTRKNQIKLVGESNFCVAIGEEKSKKGGGGNPTHLMRAITLQDCLTTKSRYTTWKINN